MVWPSYKKILPFLSPDFSIIFIFFVSFLFFYNIQFSSENIPGYDGFYHIKMAEIIKTEGITKEFKWFTAMQWIDHHFLYHVLLIPFTFINLSIGAKLSAVFFSSLMTTAFNKLLRESGVRFSFSWSLLLLLASAPFLYRMSLPRAPCVSLIFLFSALYFIFNKKYLWLGLNAFLSVWLYGGFSFIIILGVAASLSLYFTQQEINVKIIRSIAIGIICGLIINPFFPENISLIYHQTTNAGLDRIISGGGEWEPYDTWFLFKSSLILFIICMTSFFIASVSENRQKWDTLTLYLIMCVTFVMVFKSKRFVEYWVPFALLYCAFLVRDSWDVVRKAVAKVKKRIPFFRISSTILVTAFFLLLFNLRYKEAKQDIRDDKRSFERYKKCALWLKENTPGSVVFTSRWDDFPELFFYNSKNRYLVGLDPAFMYLDNRDLYKKWINIKKGNISGEEMFEHLIKKFRTPYIFSGPGEAKFNRLLHQSPFSKLEYSDINCKIYSLEPH